MQSDKLKHLPAVITEPELLPPDRVFHVAGRNWSSMKVRRMVCLEGRTVREILIEVLHRSLGNEPTAFQVSVWLDRCRCKVDGVEVSAEKWAVFKPQAGSFVEFLVSPGKGGGGKTCCHPCSWWLLWWPRCLQLVPRPQRQPDCSELSLQKALFTELPPHLL